MKYAINKPLLILILTGWTITSSYGNVNTKKYTTTSSYLKTSLNKTRKTKSKTQASAKSTSKLATHKTKKVYMSGIASYYGGSDGFEGKPMANGHIFHSQNPNLSAHPTLPLGTKLKVTVPVTNRSIYVEVTDRMPKQHRVIDLSKSAAKELGIKNRGTAYVELTVVSNTEYQLKKNIIEEELTE